MKKVYKSRLKKLWVEVSPELYDKLQECAARRNITFTKYINRSLMRFLLKEEWYENNQETYER